MATACRYWYRGAQPTLVEQEKLPQYDDSAHPAHPHFTTNQAYLPKEVLDHETKPLE